MATARSILSRVTCHAVYEHSVTEALRRARPAGFAGIQLSEAPHLSFEQFDAGQVAEIASIVRAEGLWLSLHASDDDASLFTTSPALRTGLRDYYRRLMDFAYHAGARIITIHLGRAPTWPTDEDPPRLRPEPDCQAVEDIFAENLDGILADLPHPCRVCVENLGLDDWHRDRLQAYLNDGRVGLCWDLPKSYNGAGRPEEDQLAWIRRNAHRVEQVHLHDRREGLGHRVIGTGCVDFAGLLDLLPDVGVKEYVIEVRPADKAAESLDNLRAILSAAAGTRD
jgi:sugar phosphate isomerase/epimerase